MLFAVVPGYDNPGMRGSLQFVSFMPAEPGLEFAGGGYQALERVVFIKGYVADHGKRKY